MDILPNFFCAGIALLIAHAATAQQYAIGAATVQQQLVESIGTEWMPLTINSLGNAKSTSLLLQNGTSNMAHIDQQSLSALGNQAYVAQVGAANVLSLVQTGGSNVVAVGQNGTGNQADLTQNGQRNTSIFMQKGDNNRLTGAVTGNNNELTIHQEGSNNQVDSNIRQNSQTYTINQYGSSNALRQIESTAQGTPGYTVEMRGTGINLTIEQGKVR